MVLLVVMVVLRGGSAMGVPVGPVVRVGPVAMVVWVARLWGSVGLAVPGVWAVLTPLAVPVVLVVPGWGGCSVVVVPVVLVATVVWVRRGRLVSPVVVGVSVMLVVRGVWGVLGVLVRRGCSAWVGLVVLGAMVVLGVVVVPAVMVLPGMVCLWSLVVAVVMRVWVAMVVWGAMVVAVVPVVRWRVGVVRGLTVMGVTVVRVVAPVLGAMVVPVLLVWRRMLMAVLGVMALIRVWVAMVGSGVRPVLVV